VRKVLDSSGGEIRTEAIDKRPSKLPPLQPGTASGDRRPHCGLRLWGSSSALPFPTPYCAALPVYRNESHLSIEDLRKQELETGLAAIEYAKKKGVSEVNVNLQGPSPSRSRLREKSTPGPRRPQGPTRSSSMTFTGGIALTGCLHGVRPCPQAGSPRPRSGSTSTTTLAWPWPRRWLRGGWMRSGERWRQWVR